VAGKKRKARRASYGLGTPLAALEVGGGVTGHGEETGEASASRFALASRRLLPPLPLFYSHRFPKRRQVFRIC